MTFHHIGAQTFCWNCSFNVIAISRYIPTMWVSSRHYYNNSVHHCNMSQCDYVFILLQHEKITSIEYSKSKHFLMVRLFTLCTTFDDNLLYIDELENCRSHGFGSNFVTFIPCHLVENLFYFNAYNGVAEDLIQQVVIFFVWIWFRWIGIIGKFCFGRMFHFDFNHNMFIPIAKRFFSSIVEMICVIVVRDTLMW